MIFSDRSELRRRQIVADRIGQDKIAVGKPLHERAGPEPVGTMIREVRFPDHEESRNQCS